MPGPNKDVEWPSWDVLQARRVFQSLSRPEGLHPVLRFHGHGASGMLCSELALVKPAA